MSRFSIRALALAAGTLVSCTPDAPLPSSPDAEFDVTAQAVGFNVTAVLADADTAIDASLQFRSDGLGAYTNSSRLVSVIQDIGAWVLDSRNPRQSTRRAWLDFGQPIAGSGPNGGNPIAVPSGLYKFRAIARCHLYGTTMQGLAPGASMPCPLHIAFDYGSSGYAVQMNPLVSGDPEGSPETNWATVTCVNPSSGAGPCVGWRITPSGTYVDGGGATRYRNVARLIKYVKVQGQLQPVNQGNFYFSFAISVTNP